MAQIVLHNTSKYYADETALDGAEVTFEDNVTTAIVGPSGGGKSTMLQLINGLVRPDAGRVLVFGSPIDYEGLVELRLRIGYAVQGAGLFPHMTVWDNVTLLARLNNWTRDEIHDRAAILMKLVGLPPALRGRYPHELSGGQQQRVGLCRAMMLDPKIFLLDEPFGAVDPITRREIHGEFLHLQASEARTIVLVTHDIGEALKLARRLVILDRGRVIQHDTCEAVLERPATDFVKELFQSQSDAGRSVD
ncbi:MAG: ATP-binding cassette domain-containing protein [Candidatus Krumholzibacteriia bacterium]